MVFRQSEKKGGRKGRRDKRRRKERREGGREILVKEIEIQQLIGSCTSPTGRGIKPATELRVLDWKSNPRPFGP